MYMAPHFILLRLNPSANPVIIVNAPDKTAATSKANNISISTPRKEEEAFRLKRQKRKMRVSLRIRNTLAERKNHSRRFKSLFGIINW